VVEIRIPPLRERKEDIPLLANAFLKEVSQRDGKPFRPLAPEAMDCLLQYDWPGIVRELKGAIDSGVTLASGSQITLHDLPPTISQNAGSTLGSTAAGQMNLHDQEMRLIMRALEETGGNRTEAAKKLGISRRTLHRRLKELNIS
jgi:DNA-binding NtrC family response regulator